MSQGSSTAHSPSPPPRHTEFSVEEASLFEEAFGLFDQDEDGNIPFEVYLVVMRSMGRNLPLHVLSRLFEDADQHRKGVINFDQFLETLANAPLEVGTPDDLAEAFQLLDRENTGKLSLEVLRHLMVARGEKFTEEEVAEIFLEADIQPGATHITLAQFQDAFAPK